MISVLVILLCAAFFSGVIMRIRSILSGRKGPRIMQPLYNIWVLLRKGSVFSPTSSIISQVAPTVGLAATLTAAMLVPLGKNFPALFSFDADFVLFAYLLALSRFAHLLNGLDSGGVFQGLGTARESLFNLLVEPGFFIIMGSLALLTGNTSFDDIIYNFHNDGINGLIMGVLSSFVLFNLMLVETGRVPVGDTRTHLELTMTQEAITLDNSGFDLALIRITEMLKLALYAALVASCLIPQRLFGFEYLLIFLLVQVACAAVIAWLESFKPRYSMVKNPSYMLAISAISLIAFLAAVALQMNLR